MHSKPFSWGICLPDSLPPPQRLVLSLPRLKNPGEEHSQNCRAACSPMEQLESLGWRTSGPFGFCTAALKAAGYKHPFFNLMSFNCTQTITSSTTVEGIVLKQTQPGLCRPRFHKASPLRLGDILWVHGIGCSLCLPICHPWTSQG